LSSLLHTRASEGKETHLPVQGTSMAPLLRPGCTVVVRHDVRRVRFGDVVLRWAPAEDATAHRTLLVHRVVRVGRDEDGLWFITKGDRWPRFDPPARLDDLVGKVVAVEDSQGMIELGRWPWPLLGRLLALRSLAGGILRARVGRWRCRS
ncbi:MAG: S24/S26 family peptidase, partial [Anaerolineae bacterium]|nr:S24/S26 family peptidase [Anaerolineae bacterium]